MPDDNDSALVAICHPWRHLSASFSAAACFRGLEAATRPLLLAVVVGGLGWPAGLAFFLFSFFMMVRRPRAVVPLQSRACVCCTAAVRLYGAAAVCSVRGERAHVCVRGRTRL